MHDSRIQKLLEFLEKDPQDPFLKYALATEYLNIGNHQNALSYFEDLTTQHADYLGTYYHLGRLYEHLNRLEDALRTYQKGMEVAKAQRNAHALSELRGAYLSATGQDYEDD